MVVLSGSVSQSRLVDQPLRRLRSLAADHPELMAGELVVLDEERFDLV